MILKALNFLGRKLNPCKNCLVVPMCNTICKDKQDYNDFISSLSDFNQNICNLSVLLCLSFGSLFIIITLFMGLAKWYQIIFE